MVWIYYRISALDQYLPKLIWLVNKYLAISYQHCYCRCKGSVFFSFLGWFAFMPSYFFLGCFLYHVLFCLLFLIRNFFFFLRLCVFRPSILASQIVMKSHIPLLMKLMVLTHEIYFTQFRGVKRVVILWISSISHKASPSYNTECT